jgi:hypothetical protein
MGAIAMGEFGTSSALTDIVFFLVCGEFKGGEFGSLV